MNKVLLIAVLRLVSSCAYKFKWQKAMEDGTSAESTTAATSYASLLLATTTAIIIASVYCCS